MPRSTWSGNLSFGLVSLPVKAYGAVSRQRVRFHMLHDEDGVPIEYRRVCPTDDEEVGWDHIVKGYEISPGRFVTFTKDELEALEPEASHLIDLEEFVPLEQIDPVYFDTSYYLVPDAGAAKAYALLHRTMVDAGRVGLAKVVMRGRERLVAIRPVEDGMLAMATMHYHDEVRRPADVGPTGAERGDAEPTKKELAIARQLVDMLGEDFDASKYRDLWREAVMEQVERKAEGKSVVAPDVPDRGEASPVVDIAEALRRSLEKAKAGAKAGAGKDDGDAPAPKAKAKAKAKRTTAKAG